MNALERYLALNEIRLDLQRQFAANARRLDVVAQQLAKEFPETVSQILDGKPTGDPAAERIVLTPDGPVLVTFLLREGHVVALARRIEGDEPASQRVSPETPAANGVASASPGTEA